MYIKQDEIERRCLPGAELRLDGEKEPRITGYAAVFNTWADIGGWFKESIRPGAFSKTIKENDIRALKNHDKDYVLGRNKAKPSPTLTLREDSKGLAVEILPPDTTYANDLLVSMRRGDITQMSFGFQVNKAETDFEKDERILVDVTLFDVSVVTFPAYPTTSAQVRSLFQHKESLPPETPKWEELDRIIDKLKSGEELTEEELRMITTYIPGLSLPPAKHTETPPEPPAKHSAGDTRKGDKVAQLLSRAELITK
jgi:HK97 family phage prohead protease